MSQYTSIFLVILIAFLSGGTPPLTKIALKELNPSLFIALRFLTAGLLLLPLFLRKKEKITKEAAYKTFLVSLLAVLNISLFVVGIRKSLATVASIMYSAVPIIVALITTIIYKQKLTKTKIAGIILGFLGVLTILLVPIFTKSISGENTFIGNFLVFLAVLSHSFYTVLSKNLQKHSSPLFITSAFVISTTIIQGTVSLITVPNIPNAISNLTTPSILSVLYVGFLGTAVFYLLYQHTIKKASPIVTSMVFYLQPVFTFF